MASRRRVDDSEEEEATAIDLRSSKSSASRAPAPGAPLPAKKPPPPAAKRPAPIVDDEEDEDATEFLSVRPRPASNSPPAPLPAAAPTTMPPTQPQRSQPSSSSGNPTAEPQLRARGRAVPLGESSPPSSSPSSASPASSSSSSEQSLPQAPAPPSAQRPARESTEPLLDVEALNNMPRAPRPLPNVTSTNTGASVDRTENRARHPQIDEQSTTGSHAGTSSVPRITRIHVVDSATSDSTGDHDAIDPETTLPPSSTEARRAAAAAQQVLAEKKPEPARIRPAAEGRKAATAVQNLNDETQAPDHSDSTQAAASTQPSSTGEVKAPRPVPSTADGAGDGGAHDGVLVVEAPNDAVVVVNGVDRGKGVVRVADLDRKAKHAVRIHAPGFQPWSGSVTLEGKPAAKIRPTLKPRAR